MDQGAFLFSFPPPDGLESFIPAAFCFYSPLFPWEGGLSETFSPPFPLFFYWKAKLRLSPTG